VQLSPVQLPLLRERLHRLREPRPRRRVLQLLRRVLRRREPLQTPPIRRLLKPRRTAPLRKQRLVPPEPQLRTRQLRVQIQVRRLREQPIPRAAHLRPCRRTRLRGRPLRARNYFRSRNPGPLRRASFYFAAFVRGEVLMSNQQNANSNSSPVPLKAERQGRGHPRPVR